MQVKSFTLAADKKADYAVKVKGVDIDPYPVARGKEAKFSISASTGRLSALLTSWIILFVLNFALINFAYTSSISSISFL